jgi:hypothetical protein
VGEIPADLSIHHAQAIVEVLMATKTTSSTSFNKDDNNWVGANFSMLSDLGALRHFVGICNYLLDNGDSDDGGYELTWP